MQVTRVGAPPPTATFAPALPARDEYELSARWRYWPTRASNAPYTIFHEAGSTTVLVNQQVNTGGNWHQLGTFLLAPGQGHRGGADRRRQRLGQRRRGALRAQGQRRQDRELGDRGGEHRQLPDNTLG